MNDDKNTQEVRNLKLKCNKLLDEISRLEQEADTRNQYTLELKEENRILKEKLDSLIIRSEEEVINKDLKPQKSNAGKAKKFFWKYSGMLLVLVVSFSITVVLLIIYFIFFI